MLFFTLLNVEMPTIVGILTFMSRKNFIVEFGMKKSFITSGPGLLKISLDGVRLKALYRNYPYIHVTKRTPPVVHLRQADSIIADC